MMATVLTHGDVDALAAAAIGAAAVLLASVLPNWVQARKANREAAHARRASEIAAAAAQLVKQAIGEPNGRGNLVQMQEQQLDNQERMLEQTMSFQHEHSDLDDRRFQEAKSERDDLRETFDTRMDVLEGSIGKIRTHLGIPAD